MFGWFGFWIALLFFFIADRQGVVAGTEVLVLITITNQIEY